MQCDVLVAGGGSAGLAAAISSARAGAKTMLVEHHGSLGGMATASLIHSICGLFEITSQPEPIWANPGFPKEFATRLMKMQNCREPIRMGRVDVLLTEPVAFAQLADEMIAETANLELRLHSTIVRVSADLSEVQSFTRGCIETIHPRAVVDATGDGTFAALAGIPFEQELAGKLQRPAFIFSIQGVEENALSDEGRLKISRHLAHTVRNKQLPPALLGATLRQGSRSGEAYVSVDLPGLNFNPLTAESLTQLEVEGRLLAKVLMHSLIDEVSGFKNAFISAFPARVGIRESRRIIGKYRLETTDLEKGASFPDSIALATWPMELRETATGPKLRYSENFRPCQIPLRALQARNQERLFIAGRCISASHEAQASIRVIGTCLATGEAAGIAAANSVR